MQTDLDKVVSALEAFYAREIHLLEKDLGERTLMHRLAVYLESQFAGWEVDCDYSRLGERTLRLPRGSIVSTDDHLGFSEMVSASGRCDCPGDRSSRPTTISENPFIPTSSCTGARF